MKTENQKTIEDEILEGNFLISVFNEWTYTSIEDFIKDRTSSMLHNYHEDWNKLMVVVEKINRIGKIPNPNMPDYILREFNFEILYKLGYIDSSVHDFSQGDVRRYNIQASAPTTIEAVWLTVIQFLKWYNKNNK